MKTIKFFLCALLIGMCFISCSDDKDAGSKSIDPKKAIVGTWSLRDRIPHGIEVCELQTTFQFAGDYSVEIEIYNGDEPDDCKSITIYGEYYLQEENLVLEREGYENIVFELSFQEGGKRMELSDGELTEIYIKQ